MEGLNRIISLIVGLFVVIMVFFFISKQLKLNEKWPILGGTSEVPTPTLVKEVAKKTVTINTTTENAQTAKDKGSSTQLPKDSVYNKQIATTTNTKQTAGTETKGGITTTSATTIPNTGLPTLFMPSLLGGLLSGLYLRRKS